LLPLTAYTEIERGSWKQNIDMGKQETAGNTIKEFAPEHLPEQIQNGIGT